MPMPAATASVARQAVTGAARGLLEPSPENVDDTPGGAKMGCGGNSVASVIDWPR